MHQRNDKGNNNIHDRTNVPRCHDEGRSTMKMVDTDATYSFISKDNAGRLDITLKKEELHMMAVIKDIHKVVYIVVVNIESCRSANLSLLLMDDFKMVIRIKVKMVPILHIWDIRILYKRELCMTVHRWPRRIRIKH